MLILLESLALSVRTNQALRGLTQKFLDANHFLSFYIEFFHFACLRSIFRVLAAQYRARSEDRVAELAYGACLDKSLKQFLWRRSCLAGAQDVAGRRTGGGASQIRGERGVPCRKC